MLLSVWCEARLHTLLYEDGVFNEEERYRIYNSGSVENKWKKALIISVEKHADLQKDTPITENSVGFALFNIYSRITEWLSKYFSPVIQNRNKIAHAQWVYPFVNTDGEWENSLSFKICQDSIANFKKDNLLSIEEKAKLLKAIATAINNLAIDSKQSDYKVLDFDKLNKLVQKHVEKLESINHSYYVERVKNMQKAYEERKKPT